MLATCQRNITIIIMVLSIYIYDYNASRPRERREGVCLYYRTVVVARPGVRTQHKPTSDHRGLGFVTVFLNTVF